MKLIFLGESSYYCVIDASYWVDTWELIKFEKMFDLVCDIHQQILKIIIKRKTNLQQIFTNVLLLFFFFFSYKKKKKNRVNLLLL